MMYKVWGLPTLAVLLWMLCSGTSAACGQQRISGVVISEASNTALSGVTVRLERKQHSVGTTQLTDAAGRFVFWGLSPGEYLLTATADTFRPQKLTIDLSPRGVIKVDVRLQPVANITAEVDVNASPPMLDETEAATVINLDNAAISSLPAARRSQLTDIVTPYVSGAVAGHDNFVHLRGNELSLNTFINGVSFFDNPHQLFTAGVSPDIIRSVSVFTGGFPAEFGNRFGGVLDIVTRSGFDDDRHGSITVGGGDYLRGNFAADFSGHTKKFGYLFYTQAFQTARFLNTPDPVRLHDHGKGSRNFVQLDYRLSERDTFRLLATGNGTNFELPNTIEDAEAGRDLFERSREQTAILSWDHVFSSRAALATSFYERYVSARLLPTSDPVTIQASGLRNDITYGAKTDYSLMLGQRHDIKAGIDIMGFRLREDFAFDPRENEFDVGPFDLRVRLSGGQQSGYIQDKVRITDHLTANVGLRFDHYDLVTNGTSLSPRINLAYSLKDHKTVFHFAYNRFFAPPSIENLLLSAHLGSEGRPPQISRSNFFETGVSRRLGNLFVLRATTFWRSDSNSFENTELANVHVFTPTTFSRGKSYGAEISGTMSEIKKLGLSGYFSYTAQRAFQTGPVSGGFTIEDLEPGETGRAAFDQIHTAVAGVTEHHHRSGLFVTAQFEYGSGTPASLPDGSGGETTTGLPGHVVMNLYTGIDLLRHEKRSLALQFNIENVTDRVYRIAKESEFTPVQYSPPRFLSGSITYRF